jgi:hypothetical protein
MASAVLQELRARAKAHQADIDLSIVYLEVSDLAARFNVAPSTVRDIPRDRLPYAEFGKGRKLKRRRYHPADVIAYEEEERAKGRKAS